MGEEYTTGVEIFERSDQQPPISDISHNYFRVILILI